MTNKRNRRTFEYDVTDAPMLTHALMIARNTAMMCGDKGAQKRLEEYRETFKAEVPALAKLFDEEGWAEMGMALAGGFDWGVTVRRPPWHDRWLGQGYLVIQVGETSWRSRKGDYANNAPEIAALAELLDDLAPIDSRRIELPVDNYAWA